jgi:transcriptional regulator with XRE-family HTH domain
MVLPDTKKFGKWLAKAREDEGLKQDELSAKLGTKKAHVSKMETGRLVPTLEVLQKLVTNLHVSFTEPLIQLGYLKDQDNSAKSISVRYEALTPEYKEVADDLLKVLLKRSKNKMEESPLQAPGSANGTTSRKKKDAA